ncbi:MAG TPA: hypothetical protein V6D03_08895 [Candidatus Caenarcaniphilales bacterium]
MDWTHNFEQFLKQLSDFQKTTLNSWTSTVPNMQSFNPLTFSETFDKTLKFQEEVVKSTLEFQALATNLSIETQKQLWEGYFNTIRKTQGK